MAETQSGSASSLLSRLLQTAQLDPKAQTFAPMIKDSFTATDEGVSQEDRFLSGLAAVLFNVDTSKGRYEKGQVMEAISRIDQIVNDQINEILHHPKFQQAEATWRGIGDLIDNTNFASNISIVLLDVGKEELYQDFESNSTDVFSGSLFSKLYKTEYDQYGGIPYGCLLGLYEFSSSPQDLFWLRNMAKVAAASHAPFISALSIEFFGAKSIEEVEAIRDVDGLLNAPKYQKWQELRDTAEAAYVGLTFPRYVVRRPWHPETNPSPGLRFTEVTGGEPAKYLWGNSTLLLARNLVRSFEQSGWCQYIRGPRGGGLVQGLPVDTFNVRGEEEVRIPVEMTIPDYRELDFTRNGIMSLIYRKGSNEAAYFSCPAIKMVHEYKDGKDSENSQLVANLSYTLSVTRIAHYIKAISRDNIGDNSTADSVKAVITSWLNGYTTSAVQPNDLTMRRFPFKSAKCEVKARPGRVGYYDCTVEILPHIQFEGLDVELRLEARLG